MTTRKNQSSLSEDRYKKISLDFANTAKWHASSTPLETIHDYSELVNWAERVKVLTADQAVQMKCLSQSEPEAAKKAYAEAILIRETLYRLFSSVAAQQTPDPKDVATLNSLLIDHAPNRQLTAINQEFHWSLRVSLSLNMITTAVLLSAEQLLTSILINRIGECADDRGCGWLFLDMSKNRSRRWCDMNDCGNRDKVRRYYTRHRN